MYHIAIVEDEIEYSNEFQDFLQKYQDENDVRFKVSVYEDGEQILESYEPIYDLILLDIEMPKINGMTTAEKIREQAFSMGWRPTENSRKYPILIVLPESTYQLDQYVLQIFNALKNCIKASEHTALFCCADDLDGVRGTRYGWHRVRRKCEVPRQRCAG
jgi:CheY-like chemotaxis protein